MVWPSLISLGADCAPARPASIVAPSARDAVSTERLSSLGEVISRPFRSHIAHTGLRPLPFTQPSMADQPDRAGHAAGHQVHETDQEDAVDRPRRGLGNIVGDVRDEL